MGNEEPKKGLIEPKIESTWTDTGYLTVKKDKI
jgi:hypothetical protein